MIETIYRTKRSLRALVLIIPVLALYSISPETQAWLADKLAPWVGTTLNGKPCKSIQIAFGPGPYDYLQRNTLQAELQAVEEIHFTTDVENLVSSQSDSAINDLHYTLQAWPNHHRALNSVLKFRLANMGNWPINDVPPAECYLQRAIKFSPKDPNPYMMYGVLLQKVKQYAKALNAYRAANRLLPTDVITQYNMGLTLVELKKYTEAKQLAEKVYGAGFPLPALKNKLIAAGHWKNGAGETEPKTAKPEFTPAQLDAIKKAMQDEAARKIAAPATAAP